jgi:preprotein translocase subunit SecE
MYGDTMDFNGKIEIVKAYFRDVYMEGKRITWPSRKDAMKGTYIVLITVFVAAVFLGIVDVGLAKLIQTILRG